MLSNMWPAGCKWPATNTSVACQKLFIHKNVSWSSYTKFSCQSLAFVIFLFLVQTCIKTVLWQQLQTQLDKNVTKNVIYFKSMGSVRWLIPVLFLLVITLLLIFEPSLNRNVSCLYCFLTSWPSLVASSVGYKHGKSCLLQIKGAMDFHVMKSSDCTIRFKKQVFRVFSSVNGARFSKRIRSQAEAPYACMQLRRARKPDRNLMLKIF